MKLPQILNVISAANQLAPEQTQILEKALRKLDAGHSTDEVIEYLRRMDYPLIKDRNATSATVVTEGIPATEDWDSDTSNALIDTVFGELLDTKPEVARDFAAIALDKIGQYIRSIGNRTDIGQAEGSAAFGDKIYDALEQGNYTDLELASIFAELAACDLQIRVLPPDEDKQTIRLEIMAASDADQKLKIEMRLLNLEAVGERWKTLLAEEAPPQQPPAA